LVLSFGASILAHQHQHQRKQLSVPHHDQLIHGRPLHRRLHVVDDVLLKRVVERSIGCPISSVVRHDAIITPSNPDLPPIKSSLCDFLGQIH
jgi:hypothetical protein